MKWIGNRNYWSGECPRCAVKSFFSVTKEHIFHDGTMVDLIECPEGHPFVIATRAISYRSEILFISPISGDSYVPDWLPDEYKKAYAEMMFDFKSKKYRSAISIAGIILDAHTNSLLKNPGDRKKSLAYRLELLAGKALIDQDQFADSTVARLSRNEVIHPDQIAADIEDADAKETIEAVTGCLERYYKFRRAKALPAGPDQVSGPEGELG